VGCSVDCINDVWYNVPNERLQWKDPAAGDNRHMTDIQRVYVNLKNELLDNLS